jgi:hypothetical protein
MPKHSYSTDRSSEGSSDRSKKRNKRDSLCSHCCSSKKKYLDDTCKSYFENKAELKYIKDTSIAIPNINQYLEKRKAMFDELIEYSIDIGEKDCIKLDSFNNKLIINDEIIKLSNITIDKYLSSGCYGLIFVSSENDGVKYVIKFIKRNAENNEEVNIMIDIKKNNINNIPNYINIVNYHLNCNIIDNSTSNNILTGINNCFKSNSYAMIILEYFDGTIFDLLQNLFPLFPLKKAITNLDIFYSIFAQLLLSICLFHNKFKYYHRDAHLKNFLYKKVNDNDKYFHYKINDNNYYIKNCGYIVILSDYGKSKKIDERKSNDNKKIFEDYEDIINKLCSYKNKIPSLKGINEKFNKDNFNEFLFIDEMMQRFVNIKTEKTPDMELINTEPYGIN